ncbi:putative F-box/LRR-repeat protein 9 [Lolium perenne]|uniref:putative F-box/LRR-repeat protein 9 n=1 Tax=Lolium perenne TaxID=4522 RepID=UPI0021E9F992|nr:putative F-box/LRR-repeat protein 9 [Lolium perenne]
MGIRSRRGTRDWAALPLDVLWTILSLVPQDDILRTAGLVCASWRRLALDEPLLWRRIDLPAEKDKDGNPPATWKARACAAVRRSAGRCESYRGRVNRDFLLFLAGNAPSLRSLHVTSRFDMLDEKFMTVLAKKLPMLEELVMSKGRIEHSSLAALVDHCPRLQLLDAGGCHTFNSIGESLQARLESKIKHLRLPRLQDVRFRGRIGLVRAVPFPPPTGRLGRQLKPVGM